MQCFRYLCTLGAAAHDTENVSVDDSALTVMDSHPAMTDTASDVPGPVPEQQPHAGVLYLQDDQGWIPSAGEEEEGEAQQPNSLFGEYNLEPERANASTCLFHQPPNAHSESDTELYSSEPHQLFSIDPLPVEHHDTHMQSQYFTSASDHYDHPPLVDPFTSNIRTSNCDLEGSFYPSMSETSQTDLCPPQRKRPRIAAVHDRRPLKSLDLGFDSTPHPATPLSTDDRALAVNSNNDQHPPSSSSSSSLCSVLDQSQSFLVGSTNDHHSVHGARYDSLIHPQRDSFPHHSDNYTIHHRFPHVSALNI